ncbi:MAG: hypothetical protein ACFFBP_11880 [Promethearchaeota archaeon]
MELGSRDYKGIRHVTIIEDAQYFAPQELSARTKLTSYIEDIALLLRGTGECLISLATRPNISKEILANCGVLVSFQIHMQKELMKEMLNLQEWQVKYLSELKRGQCIMRVNSIEKPFALQTRLVERSWLTDEEIEKNNQKAMMNQLDKVEKWVDEKFKKIGLENFNLAPRLELHEEGEESISREETNEKMYCKFCGSEIESQGEKCKDCSSRLELEDYVRDLLKKE